MKHFPFPGLGTAGSVKLQIQLTYSTPGEAYRLRNVGKKIRKSILPMSHVIKTLRKFHVFVSIIHQKNKQIQSKFF